MGVETGCLLGEQNGGEGFPSREAVGLQVLGPEEQKECRSLVYMASWSLGFTLGPVVQIIRGMLFESLLFIL